MEKLERDRFLKAAEAVIAPLLRSYLGKRGNDIKFTFTISKLSYSMKNTIQIALLEDEVKNLPKQDLMKILKFKGFHETSHQLYTDNMSFKLCIEEVLKVYQESFNKEGLTGYDNYLKKQSHYLVNSLEDGRIENIMVVSRPGLKKHRDWYRINDWENYDLMIFSEKLSEYKIVINEILTISTVGIHSLNFSKVYDDESNVAKSVKACIKYISKFVVSNTLKETVDYCKCIAKIVAPYLVKEVKTGENANNDFDNDRLAGGEENFAAEEQAAENGPVIAIITDDTEFTDEEQKDAKKPDIIIDLRTKKEDKKGSESSGSSSEGEDNAESSGSSSEGKDNTESSGSSSKGEDNAESSGSSSEGKDNTESNGSSSEGEDNAESSGSLSEGEDNTESNGSSSEGEDNTESSGSSSKGEDNAESNGSSSEGADNTESSGSSSKGEDNAESNGSSSEGADNTESSGSSSKGADNAESSGSSSKGEENNGYGKDKNITEDEIIQKLKEIKEDIEDKLFKEAIAEIKKLNDVYRQLEETEMQGNITPVTSEDIQDINNILQDVIRFEEIDIRHRYPSIPAPQNITSIGQTNRYKINQALEIKKEDDMRDCLHGEIDCSQLDKFITGQPDFFFNEGNNVIPEGCIFILKDDSGSMKGNKEALAIETLSIIEESIKGLLPTKITAFSNDDYENHKVIKDWDDNDMSKSYTWGYHMAGNKPSGGNEDEQSILIASKQLLKRPEANKLLIVISDGCPLSPEKVNKAVRWARNKGIFLCSFFIGNAKFLISNMENYRFMYENYFVGVTPDNLSTSLYNFIKEFVDRMN